MNIIISLKHQIRSSLSVAASVDSSRKPSNPPITLLWESLHVLVFILPVENGSFFSAMVNRLFLFLVALCLVPRRRTAGDTTSWRSNEIKSKGISTALRVEKGFYIYLRLPRYIYLMYAPFKKAILLNDVVSTI